MAGSSFSFPGVELKLNSFSSLVVSKVREAERLAEPSPLCLKLSFGCGVLWAFPMWIFKPFSDLKVPSHWSHLNVFSAVGALSFLFRKSSLLLASRLRVDGVFFFLLGFAKTSTSFPLVSTEKEKLDPMLMQKAKGSDLPASVWQISRHWDASFASSWLSWDIAAAISTAYF